MNLVKLPRVQKLPPNPLIRPAHEAWARARAPPSEISQTDSEVPTEHRKLDKSIRQLRLAIMIRLQRPFLTGSAVADLKVAQILNTVRDNETRKDVSVFVMTVFMGK